MNLKVKEIRGIEVSYSSEEILKESNVIYALVFPNGKFYVGQTRNTLQTRLSSHLSEYDKYESYKNNALRKYKKITLVLLEKCKCSEDLSLSEKYWIRKLESNVKGKGYNITNGGERDWNHTEFTKKLMSSSHKGLYHSEETKNKIREAMKGKFSKKVFVSKINKIFLSMTECAGFFGVSCATITQKCKKGELLKKEYLILAL